MKKALFIINLLVGFMLVSTLAYADTYVTGSIDTDTLWGTAGSPYVIVDHLSIAPGKTLTIEGGVEVRVLEKRFQSHQTHFDSTGKGPGMTECTDCHETANFADGEPLGSTTVCDPCHSPGPEDGFDGAAMARANWDDGVYDEDGKLKDGNEYWCAACHDAEPAWERVDGGIQAPNVIGDNITYGFYVTGHKVNCLNCHDASKKHIDGEHRTYVSTLDNYQDAYRLRSVDGEEPMKIPRPKTSTHPLNVWKDFALCFDCHDRDEIIVWDSVSHTNFWHDPTQTNYHIKHLKMYRSDFDSDWDNTGDSEYTCTACHNVHGPSNQAMIRHGELISTYGSDPPDKVPALNFAYLVPATEFATATWTFSGSSDNYYVYVRWHAEPDVPEHRASNAKYTVNHADGSAPFAKNQQTDGSTWIQFGTDEYTFVAGDSVVLSNEGADGPVVADGIGWDKDGVFVDDWDGDGVPDPEIVVDNIDASYTPSASAWAVSSWYPGFHGNNYQYHGKPEAGKDPTATLQESIGGIMDYAGSSLSQNGVCSACHGAVPYYRTPNLGPKVIFPRAEPDSVDNDGVTEVLLLAHVLDKDGNLIETNPVVIDVLPIGGGSDAQPMFDDGTNGDEVPNDGIFSFRTTVPGTVDTGNKTLLVTATDQDGQTSQGNIILEVTNPRTVVVVDNFGQTFTGDYGPWTTSTYASAYYPPDYQYHLGGAGDDYFKWTLPTIIPGLYTVYAWYPEWQSGWNWAMDATYTINHDGGSTPSDPVNQRENGGTWVSLGTYSFDGIDDYVKLNQHPTGAVIADAIKWEPQP